jgi:hypothetical protein
MVKFSNPVIKTMGYSEPPGSGFGSRRRLAISDLTQIASRLTKLMLERPGEMIASHEPKISGDI